MGAWSLRPRRPRSRPRSRPPALTPLPLSCRTSHAGQGPPAERPGLRTKGEAWARRPAPSAPRSWAGPRLWAVRARDVSAAAPRRGRAAGLGRGRAGGVSPAGQPTCPAPWLPERSVSGEGFAALGSGSGRSLTGILGSSHRCRPCPQWSGLPLPISEGRGVRWRRESKVRPVGRNAASRIIHCINLL